MFLRFLLWWEYFKKYFLLAMSKVFGGRTISWYFTTIIQVIGKWYLLMVPPAVYVVYKLYEALEKAGIIDSLHTIVQNTLYSVLYIANYCFPKILKLGEMSRCITNAPSAPFQLPDTQTILSLNIF